MGARVTKPPKPKREPGMRHRRRGATYPCSDEDLAASAASVVSATSAAAAFPLMEERFLWRASSVGSIVAGVGATTGEWLLRRTLRKGFGSRLSDDDLLRFRAATATARALSAHPCIADIVALSETPTEIAAVYRLGGEPVDLFYPSRRSSFFVMSERNAAGVVRQIASALQFLHAQKIDAGRLLGGLFFEDLMLLSAEDGRFCVKIVPTLLHGGTLEHGFDTTRTPQCVAPEVLSLKEEFGMACDIWALGVIAFMLLFGCRPFRAPTASEELQLLLFGRYALPADAPRVSTHAHSFIRTALNVRPEARPAAAELLDHPWLQPTLCGEDAAVLAYATHPRLGAKSPAAVLPREVIYKIVFTACDKAELCLFE